MTRSGSPSAREINRVLDELDGIETRTPISIQSVSVPGGASLKHFKAHVQALLGGSPPPGPRSFHEGNVYVGFEVHAPFEEPVGAVFSWSSSPIYGGQHDEVRGHIDEKLTKYKVPLVIALDFVDFLDPFATVEEVLLGTEVMHIPVDPSGAGRMEAPFVSRAADSIMIRRGADGERARSRLQAVLAFGLLHAADGDLELHARVIANPAADVPLRLNEFAPIPRLVIIEETATERRLGYLDADENVSGPEMQPRWSHVP